MGLVNNATAVIEVMPLWRGSREFSLPSLDKQSLPILKNSTIPFAILRKTHHPRSPLLLTAHQLSMKLHISVITLSTGLVK